MSDLEKTFRPLPFVYKLILMGFLSIVFVIFTPFGYALNLFSSGLINLLPVDFRDLLAGSVLELPRDDFYLCIAVSFVYTWLTTAILYYFFKRRRDVAFIFIVLLAILLTINMYGCSLTLSEIGKIRG